MFLVICLILVFRLIFDDSCLILRKSENGQVLVSRCPTDEGYIVIYYDTITEELNDTLVYRSDTLYQSIHNSKDKKCVIKPIGNDETIHECKYLNGQLLSVGNTIDNQKVGEWSYYYMNGGFQSVEYFAFKGKLTFKITYQNNGKVKDIIGEPIRYYEVSDSAINKTQQFVIYNSFINPPSCKVKFELMKLNETGKVLKRDTIPVDSMGNSLVRISFKDTGKNFIGYKWSIYNLENKLLKSDSVYKTIYVRE